MRRLLPLLVTLLWAPVALRAHTVSLTYAEVRIGQRQVDWTLRMPVAELDLLFGVDRNHNGKIEPEEWAAASDEISKYVLGKVRVEAGAGRQLAGAVAGSKPWIDPEGHEFLEVRLRYEGEGAALDQVTLGCALLEDVVSTHKTLARIEVAGEARDFVFEKGAVFSARANPPWIESVLQFVRMGVLHIFTGYDHIAFLLGVVLVGGTFMRIVKIVTSFTVAHSITLALAAFSILSPPSRIVESGIALSIVYIALENLFFRRFDRRWMVTFFFGLVHGFGFASALAEVELKGKLLVTALFSFNLGVELGQVCIVAILIPPLLWLERQRESWHRAVVRGLSAVIFVLGVYWLWERVRGV